MAFWYFSAVYACQKQGGFSGGGGGTRADLPIFLLVNIFLEPYICPYANTCLKISLYKDLLCVCATGKIQFDNTILVSTHIIPTLSLVAMLPRAFAPLLFKNSESAPEKNSASFKISELSLEGCFL